MVNVVFGYPPKVKGLLCKPRWSFIRQSKHVTGVKIANRLKISILGGVHRAGNEQYSLSLTKSHSVKKVDIHH